MPAVTREHAMAIAEDHLRRNGPAGRSISQVVKQTELSPFTRSPSVYGSQRIDWDRFWIVYLASPCEGLIASSDIVLISADTGEVLYFGSANDEG